MPTFRYDIAEMSDFVDLLDRSLTEASTLLESAKATAAAVLDSYSGTAASAFSASQQQWQAEAEQHVTALREYRTYVATARDNYANALQANREMFG
ncbi:WXG100 family type VII secretion target [Mycolicibacterium neoaurum]|uniref:WXG100 family type VII secretion target n=1 Tax=Mycolicibacterium neoaurum TaxID=1795 RepID=UPI00088FDA46|nr:WXG100 family type VII secretion target [Mycolicibacterium neoaurum]SDC05533.1 WXG100 family type VII secretion target [Mycolicibacterium neoaurum]